MIDKIKLAKRMDLDTNNFDKRMFNLVESKYWHEGERKKLYICNNNNVQIKYFPDSKWLVIKGRLLNLSLGRNKVDDLNPLYKGLTRDDLIIEEYELSDSEVYERSRYIINSDGDDELVEPERVQFKEYIHHREEDIDYIIGELNELIYKLTGHKVDVSDFNVTLVEACFNVKTDHVDEYIELFNLFFKHRDDKRYRNFVIEKNKPLNSSFYVKSKAQFENNLKSNYAVNFYNKVDQLNNVYLIRDREYKAKITEDDVDRAAQVLRLEVQCNYGLIRRTMDKHGVEKTFKDFADIDLLREIVVQAYRHLLANESLDYYSYQRAKELIQDSQSISTRQKKGLLKYCLSIARGHELPTSKYNYNKILSEKFQMAPFFIPKSFGVDYLESPIKLLDREIESVKQDRKDFLSSRKGNTISKRYKYSEKWFEDQLTREYYRASNEAKIERLKARIIWGGKINPYEMQWYKFAPMRSLKGVLRAQRGRLSLKG